MAMVFSLMKMYDPTSTVREGEQAQAQNAAGVPDRIKNIYNSLITGERLSPKQRREFLGIARDMFDVQIAPQQERVKKFSAFAAERNMNPYYIIEDPYVGLLGKVDNYIKQYDATQNGSSGGMTMPASKGVNIHGVTPRGGPGGNASPSASTPPPGFRIVG